LKDALDVEADLKVGPPGSFVVAVDGKVVVEKKSTVFPTEDEIVQAVGRALGRS